jgi:hypothetical protein
LDAAMTIGIVAVAFCAALITGVSPATMTSTLRCTTSAASSARRPTSPPANRHSIVRLRLSM